MKLKKFIGLEWEAIAGVIAAVVASILHLLEVLNEEVLLSIVLALIALLFISFMRHTRLNEEMAETLEHVSKQVGHLHAASAPSDLSLVGPLHLRSHNEKFIREMAGDTVWYNLCLSMYKSEPLFDALLSPAIENPRVTSVQFVLDESQKTLWESTIYPRLQQCHGFSKVREPHWCRLEKNLSFIFAERGLEGNEEALLSFWGAPFMSNATNRDMPRFIFHVKNHSELLPHLSELASAIDQIKTTACTPNPKKGFLFAIENFAGSILYN